MPPTPLISVIIPTYNRANLLPRAVRSACGQTYRNLEILVVDDASSDNTEEVARMLEEEDARVRYIKREKNGGGSAARNTGIRESKGEYIALLDSDDEWLSEKIEKQMKVFEKSNDEKLGVVYCGYKEIKNNKTVFINTPKHKGNIIQTLLINNYITGGGSTGLIKKECFNEIGFFDESKILKEGGSQDYDMYLRIATKYHFGYTTEALAVYHQHGTNLTSSSKIWKKIEAQKHVMKKHEALYKKYPKLLQKRNTKIAILLLLNGRMKEGRKEIRQVFKNNPNLILILHYLLSFFGYKCYIFIAKIKNSFTQRRQDSYAK
jgi:glycosyltransferase involved in cell wall biosynthesis